MDERLVVVLDIGKTHSKLTLWAPSGGLMARETRANARRLGPFYPVLDVEGIEQWLAVTLSRFSSLGDVGAIIPVGHGAAAAIIRDGALAAPIVDYEFEPSDDLRAGYLEERDAFAETGSPAMGMSLNLGLQLHCMERFYPGLLEGNAQILPWPQYWAWRLCGVPSCEVTSLGSHTDLWSPFHNGPSSLAVRRGWAERLAPRRHAGEIVGHLSAEWRERTGLARDVAIVAGLHDSNAALCGARAHAAFSNADATLISTGTWFVSMRSPAADAAVPTLEEDGGCLLNVDVEGRPAPTALFMGGREVELLGGAGADVGAPHGALLAAAGRVIEKRAMALPAIVRGSGFFPQSLGAWCEEPESALERHCAATLYAALMSDVGLDRVGASGSLLVEGRFGGSVIYARALAALRPRNRVFVSGAEIDVSWGALRLMLPALAAPGALSLVEPLELDLAAYKSRWRALISEGLPRA